jgi:hypothetical protein
MLTRRVLAAVTVVAAAVVFFVPAAAYADGGGNCPPGSPDCTVWGGDPGGGGTGGGGGGGTGGGSGGGGGGPCTWRGQPVACYIDGLGSFNPSDGCYYQPVPAPPGDTHQGGGWYVKTCGVNGGGPVAVGPAIWLPNPPAGLGPTPEQLAQQALAKIRLLGAQIGVAPSPNGAGLVGLPVWLWTAVTPNTWGPITASAGAGGLTVTITGHAAKVVWDMGDGNAVTCTNPGTPYRPSFGSQQSPTCGYVYRQASRNRPGGKYTITATTYWEVDWVGGGVTGVINTTRQSQTNIEIQEMQVVTS